MLNEEQILANTTDTVFLATGTVTFRKTNKGKYIINIEIDEMTRDSVGDLEELSELPMGVAVTLSSRDLASELSKLESEGYGTNLV